jgi:hypothetical protein
MRLGGRHAPGKARRQPAQLRPGIAGIALMGIGQGGSEKCGLAGGAVESRRAEMVLRCGFGAEYARAPFGDVELNLDHPRLRPGEIDP